MKKYRVELLDQRVQKQLDHIHEPDFSRLAEAILKLEENPLYSLLPTLPPSLTPSVTSPVASLPSPGEDSCRFVVENTYGRLTADC